MKNYEGMFILKPDLDKTAIDKILGQIQENITKNKGAVAETKELGKSRLAYYLKKYKEGVYYLVNFSVMPDAVDGIKKNLALNESILRLMIVEL
ncbi:MAG: 30S ribosomal protein S6 [Candidatus Omnitrophota bacterium]|nr:30S ribosomal protein S6 [Candidatus Omnitrophota bacterium]